jgi:hypothetical protein
MVATAASADLISPISSYRMTKQQQQHVWHPLPADTSDWPRSAVDVVVLSAPALTWTAPELTTCPD